MGPWAHGAIKLQDSVAAHSAHSVAYSVRATAKVKSCTALCDYFLPQFPASI